MHNTSGQPPTIAHKEDNLITLPSHYKYRMSANGSAMPDQASEILDKGKGKSVEQPTNEMSMQDDEDDDDEESGVEEVREHLL